MKKLSMKKGILLIIMVVAIIFAISTNVFATHPIIAPGLEGTTGGTTTDTNNGNTGTDTNNGSTGTNNGNTGTNNNGSTGNGQSTVTPSTPAQGSGDTQNTTGSTYENTTLPQTGDASDYAIFMLIVVAGVVAVYTYRKVKEYNI